MVAIVKQLRQLLMLNQSELGNKLGVSRQMIWAYENNNTIPRFCVIKKIICLASSIDIEINASDFYNNMLSAKIMKNSDKNISVNPIDEIIDSNLAQQIVGIPKRTKDRAQLIKLLKKANLIEFYNNCCICGWDESSIDLSHIGLHSKGFHFTYDNIIPLCPNHHRLFDKDLFNETEKEKICLFIEKITKGMNEYRNEAGRGISINAEDFFKRTELSTNSVDKIEKEEK